MKNIVLLLLLLSTGLIYSQKMSKKFLEGTWTSETVEINFSILDNKNLHVNVFSYLAEDYLSVLDFQFKKNEFYLKTLNEENDWMAIAKFIIIDENTMVADYVCDSPGQLIYKRLLK
jgi:hypothetical protein